LSSSLEIAAESVDNNELGTKLLTYFPVENLTIWPIALKPISGMKLGIGDMLEK